MRAEGKTSAPTASERSLGIAHAGILLWTLAGGLLGAAAAVAGWLLREPLAADSRIAPGESIAKVDPKPEERTLAQRGAALPAPPAERRALAAAEAFDSDFGVLAYGRVLDGAGVPLAGARLGLEDGEARLFSTESGGEGDWTLLGLTPGPHALRVTMEGFLPHAEEVELPAAPGWCHDVRLERALSLPVRFEDPEGQALELVRWARDPARYLGVVATREVPGPRIPGVTGRVAHRSEAGRFDSRAEGELPADLDPRYQGLLRLSAGPPLWISLVVRDVVLETRALSSADTELVFVIDPSALEAKRGEVRVRIVERESGAPITAGVALEHPSGGLSVQPRVEAGTLVFEAVLPGTLDLLLRAGEAEWLERAVDVPPGGSIDLGTIAVGRRQPLRVRLVDETGSPVVEGAWLRVVRPELVAGPTDLDQRISIQVDAQGEAVIQHLASGPTLLRAGGRNGLALVARLVDTRREAEVELVVPRGTPVVLRRRDPAPPGASYALEDADGLTLSGGSSLPRELDLRPGRYVLRVSGPAGELERVEFDVADRRVVVRYGGSG